MDKVTVSSEGRVTLPKQVRDALNLTEGSQLSLEVRGQEIVLSKSDAWKQLQGAAADKDDLMEDFATFRKQERERENSRR